MKNLKIIFLSFRLIMKRYFKYFIYNFTVYGCLIEKK